MFETLAPITSVPRPVQGFPRSATSLRVGKTLWESTPVPPVEAPQLSGNLAADVIVLGGGITGALSAYHLAKAGVNVVVLDGRPFAKGSTSASTALIQYETDKNLLELAAIHGLDLARGAYRACYRALDDLEALADALPHDTGLEVKHSLYLASRPEHVDLFDEECALRRELGIAVRPMTRGELMDRWSIDRPAALLSDRAIQLDPVRMTGALLHAAQSFGARLFTDAKALSYASTEKGAEIVFEGDHRATGKRVVFATGYQTPPFFGPSRCKLKSTYALAATCDGPMFGWPEGCMLWEKNDPYLYARLTAPGKVILGGEDDDSNDPTLRASRLEYKTNVLLTKFKRLFPEMTFTVDHAWAGTFAETPDSLPYIDALPHFPHGDFALGYGGNGILFSLLAAQILTDKFLGRANDDARLFKFNR